MLVFDQLKKDDAQLRLLAVIVFGGMVILFSGLWWIQLVSSRHFQEKLETQSIRTVRIPAMRGKILDREGRPLADNRPSYNIDLYLEELSKDFQAAYNTAITQARQNLVQQKERKLGRKLTAKEIKRVGVPEKTRKAMQEASRYEVTSNLVAELSARLQQPIDVTEKKFRDAYNRARSLPMPILEGLNPIQLARFEEQSQSATATGMDLEVQSLRYYPYGTTAAHLLGYLVHDNESGEGEMSEYNYRLTDYVGKAGLEGLYDRELRGSGGEKSVVINYLGYRQYETVTYPAEPGENLVLTIDLDIQRVADKALLEAQANVKGAVVVMDAQNGDVLAMASAPTYDPNHRIHPDPRTKAAEDARWNDEELGLQRNRALYENYHPGSIFKIVVAMAALELNAFDPNRPFHSLGYFPIPGRRKPMGDTAGPGEFDFNKAMAMSSNPYFATLGTQPGVLQKIIALGERLHLGERTGIMPRQEARGNFMTLERVSSNWRFGDTANISIGQGEIDVTPIQMAIMTAAVANGGKVFWPRLVSRIESPDGTATVETFPAGRIRDTLGVSARTLRIVHGGMLADTQTPDGSGHTLKIPGWDVAGKTGTAEVEKNGGILKSAKNTWFVSFAPEESPRYVVVATVEGGISGGRTCVPIAQKIYLALKQRDQQLQRKAVLPDGALAVAK